MRLGIYAFFDVNGSLEQGDLIYLDAVAKELDELVIVANGSVKMETLRTFERYTHEIFCRENRGMDGGAFREVLLERLPLERWRQADELVLFNNTMFGPFLPLRPLFQRFTNAPVDFWGMTTNRFEWISDHIQSYFLVFKKNVLQSDAFLRFWKHLRMDFTDEHYLIITYEVSLTGYLARAGFAYDAVQRTEGNAVYATPLANLRAGVPVLKKKTFQSDHFRVAPSEFRDIFHWAEEKHPALCAAIRTYMEHCHFDGEIRNPPEEPGVCWTNEEILSALRPYRQVYFYGLTTRSFYVATLCREKQCIFVESDACYHGTHQGEWPVQKLSELPTPAPDDAIMVVFLRKKHADALRAPLEERFRHVIYLCEPPTGQA